jgi:murein DD-endopeptidase MepM/ murein hydrolase activator NlpD
MQGYPPTNHDRTFRFAIDFAMPSRSVVTAARDGTVEFVEQGYGDDDSTPGHENVVTVDHGDGTFTRYAHLVKNGALVRRGDRVTRGQQVGWSGRTGTPFVHLHFDVTTGCSERTCQTVAVCFSNAGPHPDGLQTGESYSAGAY